LLSVIELLLSLTVEALQGKMRQNSLLSGGVGQFEPRFQGEGVVTLPVCWCHLKGIAFQVASLTHWQGDDCATTLPLTVFMQWNFAADFHPLLSKLC